MADSEELNLNNLYEGVDVNTLGGGGLYDGVAGIVEKHPDTLLYKDTIIVQQGGMLRTDYGTWYFQTGDPAYCLCSVEERTRKQAVFSDNWAQDTTPLDQGGLSEKFTLTIAAPEWHGDINTVLWYEGNLYEVDGAPSNLDSGSSMVNHWEIQARRVMVDEFSPAHVPPPAVPEGSRTWGT
ncbi:hypothetical protein [Bifidobacterium oedipodis]|uniref:Thiamine biosynthesis protein ThiS n=1 Tax=Bifidobacterium oedipodis TaxID=2675322 RepID=A0A7Y0HSR2_9BIFI|nr:hypothetical protein [Bifidobacterium sp. DSM 109957]NMM93873.1 thiamine biosynthesis protein ThiS [Bifidobacterium sp. DSM 109957]